MMYSQFVELCGSATFPPDSAAPLDDPLLLALCHDRHGHWDAAHEIAQSVHGELGSAVHAYLHREEGDESNASYWYSRANRRKPVVSLEQEWESLVQELCVDT